MIASACYDIINTVGFHLPFRLSVACCVCWLCVLPLQEHLNSAMSNLMTDNDLDVSHAARTVHDTFKRTPLRVTGGAGLLEMNGSSSGE
jgi:hypothetical protein